MAGIIDENQGMASGLAQGVQGFLTAYRQTKRDKLDEERMLQDQALKQKQSDLAEKQYGAGLAEHGLVQGDDGNFGYTPEKAHEKEVDQGAKIGGMLKEGVRPTTGFLGEKAKDFQQYVTPEQQAKLDEADKKLKATMGMANQRMDISREGLGIRKENAESARDARSERLQMTGNQQYSQNMKNTEAALLSANKAAALTEGISNGTLKSTKQLSSDLSANIASLISGGRPATVFGMSHQDFDSAYKRVQNAYAMFSGETPNTMTAPQLKQLSLDIKALQGEYGRQHEAAYRSFSANMPENQKEGLDKRFHTFRQQMGIEKQQGLLDPQGQGPQNPAAPNKAKSVQQNGHTYILNEATGEYE